MRLHTLKRFTKSRIVLVGFGVVNCLTSSASAADRSPEVQAIVKSGIAELDGAGTESCTAIDVAIRETCDAMKAARAHWGRVIESAKSDGSAATDRAVTDGEAAVRLLQVHGVAKLETLGMEGNAKLAATAYDKSAQVLRLRVAQIASPAADMSPGERAIIGEATAEFDAAGAEFHAAIDAARRETLDALKTASTHWAGIIEAAKREGPHGVDRAAEDAVSALKLLGRQGRTRLEILRPRGLATILDIERRKGAELARLRAIRPVLPTPQAPPAPPAVPQPILVTKPQPASRKKKVIVRKKKVQVRKKKKAGAKRKAKRAIKKTNKPGTKRKRVARMTRKRTTRKKTMARNKKNSKVWR